MKKNSKGYMLAETLIVTTFVAGVLIYLYVQLTNLSNSYEKNHSYNTIPDLYALVDISYFLSKNSSAKAYVKGVSSVSDITSYCENQSDDMCTKFKNLSNLENIKQILISRNDENVSFSGITLDERFQTFKDTIGWEGQGNEEYRLIASFNDGTFATLKFDL